MLIAQLGEGGFLCDSKTFFILSRCEGQKLKGLPENLDRAVKTLLLHDNHMNSMPKMRNFTKLFRFDLSYNFISVVEMGKFAYMLEKNHLSGKKNYT